MRARINTSWFKVKFMRPAVAYRPYFFFVRFSIMGIKLYVDFLVLLSALRGGSRRLLRRLDVGILDFADPSQIAEESPRG
jgi:hypothetical protein